MSIYRTMSQYDCLASPNTATFYCIDSQTKSSILPTASSMPYHNSRPKTPKVCPVCGEDVPRRALACPECGADHNSGWKEDADVYDSVDLPDEEFNYDDFVQKEFGPRSLPAGFSPFAWLVVVVIIVSLVLMAISGR
jgi:hypothetical protein